MNVLFSFEICHSELKYRLIVTANNFYDKVYNNLQIIIIIVLAKNMTGWCIFGVVSYIEYFIVYFLKIFLHLSYGNIFFSLSSWLQLRFALGAFVSSPTPGVFLSLLPSNIIGEMWIGVTTALVIDLAP